MKMKNLLLFFFFTVLNNCLCENVPSAACLTEEYFNLDTGNCEFNPDAYLNTPQIIKRHGYSSESHAVETEDGYLLTLHRIPGPKNGTRGTQPVFLQHGLLSSSADWVITAEKSLAFMLADMGFDVWLGNARGNTYSKGHVSLSTDSSQYWNFSWHEMGIYDLPASLNYIANLTNSKGEIIYIGHSMGTTMFFVLSSILPNVTENVKMMVALAPVAYMTHIKSPIRYLAPFTTDFQWIAKHLGINQFLPSNKIMKFLAYDCLLLNNEKQICDEVLFVICGFDKDQFNTTLLPVVLGHDPAGASTKTLIHYAQEIAHEGMFRQFDYGAAGNMLKYGTLVPPNYNISNINVPIYLMYGDSDTLTSPIDIKRLAQNLTNNIGLYEVPLRTFNHVDFIFAKDAPQLVYKQLIDVIKKHGVISNEV